VGEVRNALPIRPGTQVGHITLVGDDAAGVLGGRRVHAGSRTAATSGEPPLELVAHFPYRLLVNEMPAEEENNTVTNVILVTLFFLGKRSQK
jgi:hypothetical protein